MYTPLDTTDWVFGKHFLEILCNKHELLAPEFIGNEERCIKQNFDMTTAESLWAPVCQMRIQGSLREFSDDFFGDEKNQLKVWGIFFTQLEGAPAIN